MEVIKEEEGEEKEKGSWGRGRVGRE